MKIIYVQSELERLLKLHSLTPIHEVELDPSEYESIRLEALKEYYDGRDPIFRRTFEDNSTDDNRTFSVMGIKFTEVDDV